MIETGEEKRKGTVEKVKKEALRDHDKQTKAKRETREEEQRR